MSFLRSRLPSRRDIFLVFAVTTTPIHLWALLNFLREVPGYILRAQLGFILAVLSYTLASCLIESLVVTSLVVLLATITPRRFLLDRFVPQASILVLVPEFWVIPVHYQGIIIRGLLTNLATAAFSVYIALVAMWLITFIVALIDFSIIFQGYPKVDVTIRDVADRLTVLASVFILLGVISLGNMLVRNLIL